MRRNYTVQVHVYTFIDPPSSWLHHTGHIHAKGTEYAYKEVFHFFQSASLSATKLEGKKRTEIQSLAWYKLAFQRQRRFVLCPQTCQSSPWFSNPQLSASTTRSFLAMAISHRLDLYVVPHSIDLQYLRTIFLDSSMATDRISASKTPLKIARRFAKSTQ